jgi:hypothetical protein
MDVAAEHTRSAEAADAEPAPCLAALVSASWTIRYAARSVAAGKSVTGPVCR